MSHAYSLRTTESRRMTASRRPVRSIVLCLMLVTSSIAVYDLYLFATSGFH